MTVPVCLRNGQSFIVNWVYKNLASRRVLPLSVLTLWGCLVLMGLHIHATTPRTQVYQYATPFYTTQGSGIDYYQFWIVGQAQKQLHPDNIYSTHNRQRMADLGQKILKSNPKPSLRLATCVKLHERIIETFSTPFLYSVANIFASGEYDRDYDFYMNLCLACLVLSIVIMGLLLRFSLAESLLFTLVVLLWCEPMASDLRMGNVNLIQLAGVALYLLLRYPSQGLLLNILSGMALGLLVAFKPTLGTVPILLILAWIIDRRWRTLLTQSISAAAGATVAFLAGCRFLNSWPAWRDWKNALQGLENVSNISVQLGNYSLARVIAEASGGPGGIGINLSPILFIFVLLLVGAGLFLTRRPMPGADADRHSCFERDFLVTALGCALSIVALKLVWLHYYILLIPLLLYTLRPGIWIRPNARSSVQPQLFLPLMGLVAALLVLAAVFGNPLALLFGTNKLYQVQVYIGGAWGLMLLGVVELWLNPAVRDNK